MIKRKNCCFMCVVRKCVPTFCWSMIMMKQLYNYQQQINSSSQNSKETKVFQEVASPEVSKLNRAVMNKDQGDQMQKFSLEKGLEKRKWIHILIVNSSYQSMDYVMKAGNWFINFTIHFFTCIKMFIIQRKKAELRWEKKWVAIHLST